MNHQIANKLAAVVLAVLMNGLLLGSMSYLFAGPQTAMSSPAQVQHARTESGEVAYLVPDMRRARLQPSVDCRLT